MKPVQLHSFPGRTFMIDDREYLYFGGTAYLGIQIHPEFQVILKRSIDTYGTNYGASRLSNIQLDVYDKTENQLSNWVGCESSLTLSSGYLAGQLLVQYFQARQHVFFHAPNTHTALQLLNHRPFRSYKELGEALDTHLQNSHPGTPVVLIDTIDFSNNHYPGFEAIRSLPLDSCILLADDSHGIGLVGPHGDGCYGLLSRLQPKELVVCCSLGKALGIQAGAVFGGHKIIEELKMSAFYAGASPAPAAFMNTLGEALPLYATQRELLLSHIRTFFNSLNNTEAFRAIENYPVFEFDDKQLVDYLYYKGICVTSFNYPPGENNWQARIVLSAAHKVEDLIYLADTINAYHEKEG